MDKVILFDGECNFCDQSVQFIIKRDPTAKFKFASLQSDIGKNLLNQNDVPEDINSFVYIDQNKCHTKSTAALKVSKNLKGLWKLAYILIVVPKPVRDFFYGILAKNRYKWFGKKDSCTLPSPEQRKRFL